MDIATGIGEPAVTAARKLVGLSSPVNKINDNENKKSAAFKRTFFRY